MIPCRIFFTATSTTGLLRIWVTCPGLPSMGKGALMQAWALLRGTSTATAESTFTFRHFQTTTTCCIETTEASDLRTSPRKQGWFGLRFHSWVGAPDFWILIMMGCWTYLLRMATYIQ